MAKREVTYEIVKNIAVLNTSDKGWTKEINLISWNGKEPVVDIRSWSPDKSVMGKGITLTQEEWELLIEQEPFEEEE